MAVKVKDKLRIGVQTLMWGDKIKDIDEALEQIKAIGYEGVDFAQAPKDLPSPKKLEEKLRERGLKLLGMAGGSLEDRIRYCNKLQTKPLYLFMNDWDADAAALAVKNGYQLGLHLQQFNRIDRFSKAAPLLQAHPELGFLPDTGHLWLAGDNIIRVLEQTKDRVVAVHLKDWCPNYGRSFGTFSRGFTELGRGNVPLGKVRKWLKENFKGWIIVEQDHTETSPAESAEISFRWWRGKGPEKSVRKKPRAFLKDGLAKPMKGLTEHTPEIASILDVLSQDSCRDINYLYATIARCFANLLNCEFCSVWEVSPHTDTVILQSYWPVTIGKGPRPRVLEFSISDSLAGQALHRAWDIKVVTGLQKKAKTGEFKDASLIEDISADTMVAIPVFNTFSIHQPELLINAFTSEPPSGQRAEELNALCKHVAIAVERIWGIMRARASDEINYSVGEAETVADLLDRTLQRILIHTRCMGASVFLVNALGTRLELAATTGLQGDPRFADVYYELEEIGLVGQAWRSNEIVVSRSSAEDESSDRNPLEVVEGEAPGVMLVPISDTLGNVIGVIRCRGKVDQWDVASRFFSVTDEMVIEAIQTALSPHLVRLLSAERRNRARTRLRHELRLPIAVTRGAVEFMQYEMKKNSWSFSRKYLENIEDYMNLMAGLLGKVAFLRPGQTVEIDRLQKVFLIGDVIAPAVGQVGSLLDERGFDLSRINYGHVRDSKLPPLYVDKARFQQVVFNLLENAIKYAFDNSNEFRVEIKAVHVIGGWNLIFRDWGSGIDEKLLERIFEEGVRGPSAYKFNVSGDGIGLWIVRRVVEAHGGHVSVSRSYPPTEIVIFLPEQLRFPPSKKTHNPAEEKI
ncbi:MAG: ATP-binding protein [Phycisphaerae bacterium]|jgi:signal transduction histidine kinase/sugar phosphate isomerase/epimerase|nr:ATP-binding protein [Phycisphaerae bacterium]